MGRIGAAVAREIREAIPATVFFLWLFHMIALTKAVLLGDYSITALRASTATVGALIVAKAILIVQALPTAGLFSSRLAFNVVWKALLFGAVTLLFRFVEEVVHLTLEDGDVVRAIARLYEETSWPQLWVFQLWLFGALLLSIASPLSSYTPSVLRKSSKCCSVPAGAARDDDIECRQPALQQTASRKRGGSA